MPVREEVRHGVAHSPTVVDDDRVRLDAARGPVDEHDRQAVLELAAQGRVVGGRRGDDERADAALDERLGERALALRLLVGARGDELEAVVAELALDTAGQRGVERVRRGRR
ncbi:hypothetical protein IU11_05830 [Cellulosimicrobium sp. MM]|nr:hypothetical protein [Cellulosimicrobium sp. MM]KFD44060.1 hypothetical protein IU11_05830 [Cellulosimicrobium sp. MM]